MSCLFRGIFILIAFSLSSSGQTPDLTIIPFPQPPTTQSANSLYPGSDLNGLQIARASNGNYILITESRQELIPRQYGYTAMDWDEIADSNLPSSWTGSNFRHTGNYLVTANNILGQEVMGVIDKSGNVILPLYDTLSTPDSNGNRLASLNGKQGEIDAQGNTVIDFLYDSIGPLDTDGNHPATLNGQQGTVNHFGIWWPND